MKKILVVLTLALLFAWGGISYAGPGPLMVSAHVAAWDREADALVTGYYIYWKASGAPTWVATQKSALIPQPAVGIVPTYELLQLNLPNGSYEIAATAIDAAGDESGVSNIVPFVVYIPAPPSSLRKQ